MNRQGLFKFTFPLVLLCISTAAQSQVVAVGEERLLAAWNVSSGEQWVLYAGLSDFTGTGAPPVRLSENTFPSRPAVATDGERFLVVWPEVVGNTTRIQATIFGEGEFTIADDVSLAPAEIAPVAVWTGKEYVVFWQTHDGTDLAVVTAAGVVEFTHAIAGIGRVISAAVGRVPVLLWMERPLDVTLHAAVLGPDWNVADGAVVATMPVSTGGGPTLITDPQIAWNGSSFYVTWTAARGGRYVRIEGTRLADDGRALDTYLTCELGPFGTCGNDTRIAGSLIYNGCCDVRSDALLAAGFRFVKAWVGPGSRSSHDHQAALIDSDGSTLARVQLEPPKFPPFYGTMVVLPSRELAIVNIVNHEIDVQRLGSARRRAVR